MFTLILTTFAISVIIAVHCKYNTGARGRLHKRKLRKKFNRYSSFNKKLKTEVETLQTNGLSH